MGIAADNKFTWVIKNFSSVQSKTICSDSFEINNCKWRLLAYPKGFKPDYFSLFLEVADYKSLPSGWKRHARYLLTLVNQISENSSKRNEAKTCFDEKRPGWGLSTMLPLAKLHAKDSGFLVNDEIKIVAEVDVFEVIGKLEESETAIQPLIKKIKRDVDDTNSVESNDLVNEVKEKETIDVNGFEVLPSQVVLVRRIFEKHPDIALQLRPKKTHLKTAYMNFLLNIIETLCHSPQDLSNEDLVEADIALRYVKDSGFKVDWLEQKMEEVKGKKKDEETGESRMQELEEELKDLKQKCLDIEDLMEKEKEKVLAARAPLTLDDVV